MQPTPLQEAWLIANGHDMDWDGRKAKKQAPRIGWGGVDADADAAAFKRMMAAAPKR